LHQVRWTEDVIVDGELRRSAPRNGTVRASVSVTAPDRSRGTLDIRWNEEAAQPLATIRGSLGGRAVFATASVP
jgi:hypothetical protein